MKTAYITILSVLALSSAWLFHRMELDVGRVLDDEGNGKLYNGESFYNYIHYPDRLEKDDIVVTFDLLNPLNTYCDDVIYRTDFCLFKDAKG